jgi:hypothetical protein
MMLVARRSSSGKKLKQHVAENTLPFSADIENAWSFTPIPHTSINSEMVCKRAALRIAVTIFSDLTQYISVDILQLFN